MKKRIWSILLVLCMLLSLAPVGSLAVFKANGNDSVTRGLLMQFFWENEGSPEPEDHEDIYVDVSPEASYYKAVYWAQQQWITTGVSQDQFAPDSACTRAQVTTFLYRISGADQVDGVSNPFVDVREDTYYYEPVLWLTTVAQEPGDDWIHVAARSMLADCEDTFRPNDFAVWRHLDSESDNFRYPVEIEQDGISYVGYVDYAVVLGLADPNLTEVNIPDTVNGVPVTEIAESAFLGCANLEHVRLPASLTAIGQQAFYWCESLTEIEIPEGVVSIGESAFEGCGNLESVSIPSSLHNIRYNVFKDCAKLTNVELAEGLNILGVGMFRNCRSLQHVTIPDSMCEIYAYAFYDCGSLRSIELPKMTYIGTSAFLYSGLESVSLSGIDCILEDRSFSGCPNLRTVEIGDGVATINAQAFGNCPALEAVTIPDSATEISDLAFLDSPQAALYYGDAVTDSPSLTITEHPQDVSGTVGETVTVSVEAVGQNPLSYQWQMGDGEMWADIEGATEAVLSLDLIPEYDGHDLRCGVRDEIRGVTLFSKVCMIRVDEVVHIQTQPTDIIAYTGGDAVFSVKAEGEGLSYQWQYKTPSGAWKNSSAKTQGYNTDTLTVEATKARDGYKYRCVITDAEGNTQNTVSAMLRVSEPADYLTYKIENGEVTITGHAESLPADLVIPDTIEGFPVTAVEEDTFYGCDFKSVKFPDTVTRIGAFAFGACYQLESVELPANMTELGEFAFSDCQNIKRVTFPENLTSIGAHAFASCHALTDLSIPASVTSIDTRAFMYCSSLTNVEISENVVTLGKEVFRGCPALQEIRVAAGNPNYQSIDGVLFDKSGTQLLCYPAGREGDYVIPDGVELIDDAAFDWSQVSGVLIPDSVTEIGRHAFMNCSNLTEVKIPEGITIINPYTFCFSGLQSIQIPESLQKICDSAFDDCSALTDVFYAGTPEQFESVSIEFSNDPFLYAAKHFGDQSAVISAITGDVTCMPGETAYFHVIAEGFGLTYQWQYKTPSGGWKNCTAKTWGHDTETLIVDATKARDGYRYRCVVTAANGTTATSEAVLLRVAEFAIATQPSEVYLTDSDSAVFHVETVGENLTYQWQYMTPSGDWKNCSAKTEGYNTDTLTVQAITGKTIRNGYQYRCVVSNGREELISDAAALWLAPPSVWSWTSAVKSYSEGETHFNVKANGFGLTYQWQYKTPTGDWKNCSSKTEGYNTDTLTVWSVSGSTNRNGYQYRCVITDVMGNTVTSDPGTLTVFVIKTQPTSVTASAGTTAKFKVAATGEDLSYQWQYKTPSGAWKNCSAKTAGYNTATLKVSATAGRNGYQYRCVITDADGSTLTTSAATLAVK